MVGVVTNHTTKMDWGMIGVDWNGWSCHQRYLTHDRR